MSKSASRDGEPPRVTPPRTIDLASVAIVLTVVGLVVRALTLLGSSSTLSSYLTNLNAKAKKPVANYSQHVAADLHSLRVGALVQSGVVVVALLLLVTALRRTRSANGSRWGLLIIIVLTSLPFYVVPVAGWPVVPKVASVIAGIAAVSTIVLIFVPQSMQYFRSCRDAVTPPERRGQARTGLAGLFAPRQPRQPRGGLAARNAAPAERASRSSASPTAAGGPAAKAKAKVRADSDSVAKGAELARSRAKASKSRRTDA